MSQITDNFYYYEFECLGTACCGRTRAINTTLVKDLQLFRNFLVTRTSSSEAVIKPSSGFRCIAYEHSKNRSGSSQHCLGHAADLTFPNLQFREAWEHMEHFLSTHQCCFNGVGLYPQRRFIHIDMRPNAMSSWGQIAGEYVSMQEAKQWLQENM